MPLELTLRRNLSASPLLPNGLALRGIVDAGETEAVAVKIYWRWEDEPDMKPEFLCYGKPGETANVPFDPKGREMHFYSVSLTEKGVESVRNLADAVQTTFDPTASRPGSGVIASVDLIIGDIVDIYNDAGTLKARKADATDNTRPADAFVLTDGLTDESILVNFAGETVEGLSGLTPGLPCYLSETPGGVTQTPITSGTGKICQEIGIAMSATTMIFMPMDPVELA